MSILGQQNPKAVDYFALLMGIIGAALESGLIVLLCLGELGGPIDLRAPVLAAAGVLLAILAICLRFRVWWHGILSGLFFAVPVALVCFVLGSRGSSFSAQLAKDHGGQLRFAGLTVVLLSVSVLTIKASIQSKRDVKNEKAAS